jgi:hypothetical protein
MGIHNVKSDGRGSGAPILQSRIVPPVLYCTEEQRARMMMMIIIIIIPT